MATPPINPRASTRTFASVTISSAADGLSDSVSLSGLTLSAIATSTAWTAAVIGVQTSVDNSTNFLNMYDKDGNLYYFTVGASRFVAIDPALFAGVQTIRLISETTAGVAVAQAAPRVIQLGLSKTLE